MIRLLPMEDLMRDRLMAWVQRRARGYMYRYHMPDQADDCSQYVLLKIIPKLRVFMPGKVPFLAWLGQEVRSRCGEYYRSVISKYYSFHLKQRVRSFVSLDESLDDNTDSTMHDVISDPIPRDLRYENYEYHEYIWEILLPQIVGRVRARLLYYQFVEKMQLGDISIRFGSPHQDWAQKANADSIGLVNMAAGRDPKVRRELLR